MGHGVPQEVHNNNHNHYCFLDTHEHLLNTNDIEHLYVKIHHYIAAQKQQSIYTERKIEYKNTLKKRTHE